jgi:hypothetical protein
MARRTRVQTLRKRYDRKCFLCPEDRYAELDCHRIVPGVGYRFDTTLTLCAGCHRKVTVGTVVIVARRLGTGGTYIEWVDAGGVTRFTKE